MAIQCNDGAIDISEDKDVNIKDRNLNLAMMVVMMMLKTTMMMMLMAVVVVVMMGLMIKSILSDTKEFLEQEIEPFLLGFGVGPIVRCLTKESSRGAQILVRKNGLSGFKLRMEPRVLFGSKPTAAFLSVIPLLRTRNGTMSQ